MSKGGAILPKIKFPIIISDINWSFLEYVANEEIMTTRPKQSINSDPLIDCLIIDSNGFQHIVSKIIDLGKINFFFGYSFTLGRAVFVNIYLEKIKEYSLDEIKNETIAFLNSNFNQYKELGFDTNEVKQNINSSESIKDLILLMKSSSGIGI